MFGEGLRKLAFLNRRSRLNAALSAVEGAMGLARPHSLPVRLDLVLTKACNLRCRFCISYGSVEGGKWMDFALYQRIARELFPTAAEVSFCSGGEPLLYPRLREALALARDSRCLTLVVSNGMLLDRETCAWMVRDQSLWNLNISFDAATPETLGRLRQGADFDLILSNLKTLAEVKRDLGAARPAVGLRFAVMRSNAEELPRVFSLAAKAGVERVLVNYLKVANNMDPGESLYHHPALAAQVFAQARAQAREAGVRLSLPPLPGLARTNGRCRSPWNFVQIDPDGAVRHCYFSWLQRLGRFQDGFPDLWQGDIYARIRKTLNTPEPYYPFCRTCPVRRGWGVEDSHYQDRPGEEYLIPGLERFQTGFKPRSQENAAAFRAGSRDDSVSPPKSGP